MKIEQVALTYHSQYQIYWGRWTIKIWVHV